MYFVKCTNCGKEEIHESTLDFSSSRCNDCNSLAFGLKAYHWVFIPNEERGTQAPWDVWHQGRVVQVQETNEERARQRGAMEMRVNWREVSAYPVKIKD